MRWAPTRFRVRNFKITFLVLLAMICAGCVFAPASDAWEGRLQGHTIVLLGEVHDNAEHHRQRLDVLRRALAAGWRPAIAMEQFDRERQADIDRARREQPRDAQHVIDLATAPAQPRGGGWNWAFYRPFVDLALKYGVPLIAVNLSSADANKVVREGYPAVFDAAGIKMLNLDQPIALDWQAAQEREIDRGHCHALPAKMLPVMARGQLARDAVMASLLARHATQGVVLLAGNGHVRRDIGVPRWFNTELRARTWAVGYLEQGEPSTVNATFDTVVRTVAATRIDPCIEFTKRIKPR